VKEWKVISVTINVSDDVMDSPRLRFDLTPLFAPRRIAIVGASEAKGSWAPDFYKNLRAFGFSGDIYAVNPKYSSVWGLKCWHSIAELPDPVDLAVLLIPASAVPAAISDLAAAGAGAVMIVSSGFGETGSAGLAIQEEIARLAKPVSLPILGPNVEGFVNYVDRVAPIAGTLAPDPQVGEVMLISQSGALVWYVTQAASDRGIGMRIALSVGNEAVLTIGDLLSWAAADPNTSVIGCYIEVFRDIPSLERGLADARNSGKPVIICAPSARSASVQRSIVAHTGALAGNTGVRDAWLRAQGALIANEATEFMETIALLLSNQEVRSPGVVAAMESGGDCTLFAEAAEAVGLELAPLTESTTAKVKAVLPPYANPTNPLDVTGQSAFMTEMYTGALDALASDPKIGVIVIDAGPPRTTTGADYWAEPILAYAERVRERGLVVVSALACPLGYSASTKDFVRSASMPFLHGHRAAANAIKGLLELDANRKLRGRKPQGPKVNATRQKLALELLAGRLGTLDETQSARLMQLYSIARPDEVAATSTAEAVAAARRLSTPVVVKAVTSRIAHKAKVGAVRVGLSTSAEIESACAAVLKAAAMAGDDDASILVQEMVNGPEILVGAIVDQRFGPALTIRRGGVAVERVAGRFLAVPLAQEEAEHAVEVEVRRLGLEPSGRGVAMLLDALMAFSQLAYELKDVLLEVEANPIIVAHDRAVAVDCLVVLRSR
jgi:acyl-CoA synthetase (NDP forming)